MLKKHPQLASSLFAIADLAGVAVLWVAAYCHVFGVPFDLVPMITGSVDPSDEGWSQWESYRYRLPVAVVLAFIAFRIAGFWKPRRRERFWEELPDLIKGIVVFAVLLSVYGYWESPPGETMEIFSRRFVGVLCGGLVVWVGLCHLCGRSLLRKLRRRGYNLRHVLIVGAGDLGRQVLERLRANRWMGLNTVGFLDDDGSGRGAEVEGVPVLGSYADINTIIADKGVDQVFIALPREHPERLHEVMESLSIEAVDVRIVPDLTDFVTLRMSVGDLDGMPLIGLQETPLVGWNRVVKRVFDIVVGGLCLLVFAVPMLLIALLVKMTSRGPVFYRQERMGLDGRNFEIWKFRSMRVDAESETGAVWAKEGDDRRTPIGAFLRASNLDELPQLFNVLRGEMSLVGPRPERPVFIEDFKTQIPRYMLRHRMKAGMTGWAQVNGWRGNTSLEKRIQCDLYYIENWSLWLDIRIMLMQLFRWRSENAY